MKTVTLKTDPLKDAINAKLKKYNADEIKALIVAIPTTGETSEQIIVRAILFDLFEDRTSEDALFALFDEYYPDTKGGA